MVGRTRFVRRITIGILATLMMLIGNTAKVTLGERKIMYSIALTLVNPSFRGTLRVIAASHSRWAGGRRVLRYCG